jgi:hypothetical protein
MLSWMPSGDAEVMRWPLLATLVLWPGDLKRQQQQVEWATTWLNQPYCQKPGLLG